MQRWVCGVRWRIFRAHDAFAGGIHRAEFQGVNCPGNRVAAVMSPGSLGRTPFFNPQLSFCLLRSVTSRYRCIEYIPLVLLFDHPPNP